MDDLAIKCQNIEQSYGIQIMVDQLVEEGLSFKQAIKIAKKWVPKK